MNLDKLKKLPLQDRIAELKKLKQKFLSEKNRIAKAIKELENEIKKREGFAQSVSSFDKKQLANEVQALTIGIRQVKSKLSAKEQELKLTEQALNDAEQQIMNGEKQAREVEQKEKNRLDQLIAELNQLREQNNKEPAEDLLEKQLLEEETEKVKAPESMDYMKKQNENLYKSQTNRFFEEVEAQQTGYTSNARQSQEEESAGQRFYKTDEKGRRVAVNKEEELYKK